MVGEISGVARTEVLRAIRNRYKDASKKDKGRMLDEVRSHGGLPQEARGQTSEARR